MMENTPKKPFDPQEFATNSYQIKEKDLRSLRCIDDREDRLPSAENPLPDYAVPGAGLGIVLDAMAAVYVFANDCRAQQPDAPALFTTLKAALYDTVTYHTDTQSGDNLPCAGCGYCAASFKDPEKNLLPAKAVEFVKSEALTRCTQELQQKGIHIPAYSGNHVAKAVMIVKGSNIGLPSTSSNSGDHAYIYHHDVRNELLEIAAESLFPLISDFWSANPLTLEQWKEKVIAVADIRLGNVLEKLAKDLPQFTVEEKSGQAVVS